MLDAFIIEQIRRRESVDDRPTLQLPLPEGREPVPPPAEHDSQSDDDGQRGVVIIDFGS